MKNLEALLADWRIVEPQQVAIKSIAVDSRFQPRNTRLAPYLDRTRLESESERHIGDLASKLEDGRELEPVLVARVDGKQYLIDGHHRRMAYQREGRQRIPARIMDTQLEKALMASKAANADGVKLPMHLEQRRDAAWQYLAMRTSRGCLPLPKGESLRAIGRTFGVSKDTAARMLRQLATVRRDEFTADACDPGTDWPRWVYVKGNAIRDRFADIPSDARERHRDEKRAAALAKVIDRDGLDAFLRALRLLESEALATAADQLAEAAAAAESGDY